MNFRNFLKFVLVLALGLRTTALANGLQSYGAGGVVTIANGGTTETASQEDGVLVGNGTADWGVSVLTTCTGASKAVTYDAASNTFGCNTISSGTTITDTITMTGTATTNLVTSATTAATATATVGALTLKSVVALDANDAILDVQSSAAAHLLRVDLEGDLLYPGNLTSANATTASWFSDALAANTSSTVGAFTIKPTATLDANDLVCDMQSAAAAHLFTVDLEGDAVHLGTLTAAGFSNSGTTALKATAATGLITSDTTAATASTTVAAFTMKPTATLGSNDLVLDVQSAAATHLFTVDLEGDTVVNGGLTPGQTGQDLGSSSLPWRDTYVGGTLALSSTATSGTISSTTSAATASTTVGAFTLIPTATLGTNDLVLDVQSAAAAHLITVDLEGDVVVLGKLAPGQANQDLGSSSFKWRDFYLANSLLWSSTTQTGKATSAISAATASTTVAAITVAPTATLDANDLLFAVQAVDNGSTVLSVDLEGDTVIAGKITTNYFQGLTFNAALTGQLGANATAANTTSTAAELSIVSLRTLDADDAIFGVVTSASANVFLVDLEGDTTTAGVATSNGGVKIGTTGTKISSSYRATSAIDFVNKVAAGCQDSSGITVTGAAVGSECSLGLPASPEANSSFLCYVSATDTAVIRHCCHTANCDPASATYAVRVFNP